MLGSLSKQDEYGGMAAATKQQQGDRFRDFQFKDDRNTALW